MIFLASANSFELRIRCLILASDEIPVEGDITKKENDRIYTPPYRYSEVLSYKGAWINKLFQRLCNESDILRKHLAYPSTNIVITYRQMQQCRLWLFSIVARIAS